MKTKPRTASNTARCSARNANSTALIKTCRFKIQRCKAKNRAVVRGHYAGVHHDRPCFLRIHKTIRRSMGRDSSSTGLDIVITTKKLLMISNPYHTDHMQCDYSQKKSNTEVNQMQYKSMQTCRVIFKLDVFT